MRFSEWFAIQEARVSNTIKDPALIPPEAMEIIKIKYRSAPTAIDSYLRKKRLQNQYAPYCKNTG